MLAVTTTTTCWIFSHREKKSALRSRAGESRPFLLPRSSVMQDSQDFENRLFPGQASLLALVSHIEKLVGEPCARSNMQEHDFVHSCAEIIRGRPLTLLRRFLPSGY